PASPRPESRSPDCKTGAPLEPATGSPRPTRKSASVFACPTPCPIIELKHSHFKMFRSLYPRAAKTASLSRQALSSFTRPIQAFVAGLLLPAGLLLLAACANLGNLFAAR